MTDTAATDRNKVLAALRERARSEAGRDARHYLREETDRLSRLTVEAGGLQIDFSKQDLSLGLIGELLDYARACDFDGRLKAMAAGERINTPEDRAVSHMALRGSGAHAEAIAAAKTERERAYAFARSIRSGERKGATGKPFRSIIHIGIGGSDLGPRLMYEALSPVGGTEIDIHFVASVDPTDLADAVAACDPEETLVFIVSKSFATAETAINGAAAMAWLRGALGDTQANAHLIAGTSMKELAIEYGVPADAIFDMWDWVGGRFSMSSVVGLSCMIALGPEVFDDFLAGAAAMDAHFLDAPLEANAPVLMALAGFAHRNLKGRQSLCVAPYAKRFGLLPMYLQQLVMESNGKSVRLDGSPVDLSTAPVIWGAEGPNAQHSFFQMLHQGTDAIPVDFIAVEDGPGDPVMRRVVMSNAIGQAETLMQGLPTEAAKQDYLDAGDDEVSAEFEGRHKTMPGGRPSTFILAPRVDGRSLGALIALYEHVVFTGAVLTGINAFDQWGVQLGKKLALAVQSDIEGGDGAHDPSTQALIERARKT